MTTAHPSPATFPCPDIRGGRIVNTGLEGNRWATEIQSVLVAEQPDRPSRAFYLSHECRFEAVAFGSEPPAAGDTLVKRRQPYQFLTFTEGERFYHLPWPDTLFGPAALEGTETLDVGDGFVFRSHSRKGWVSRVTCPWTEGREISFADLSSGLAADTVPLRSLFLRARFDREGRRWTLYCPCRYLNFPDTAWTGGGYLQPISGHVLFPYGDSFLAGYLVAAADGTAIRLELAAPRYRPLAPAARLALGLGPEEAAVLDRLGDLIPAYVPTFDLVVPVEGEIAFYRQKG